MMKVKILTIEPAIAANSLDILMLVGIERYKFRFTSEFKTIADRQVRTIVSEDDFWETFKFNQHIFFKVTNLVRQIYDGEVVKLPADIGDFGTPEDAIALQKPLTKRPENARK